MALSCTICEDFHFFGHGLNAWLNASTMDHDAQEIEVSFDGRCEPTSPGAPMSVDSSKGTASIGCSNSFTSAPDSESGLWICKPYKAQLLQREIDKANEVTGDADAPGKIIEKLRTLGVRVFVIPYTETEEMFSHIRDVIKTVAQDTRILPNEEDLSRSLYDRYDVAPQSCLLYQDRQGRLFNLTIDSNGPGVAGRWKDLLETFSGLQAMVALTVLARSFPCASADETDSLEPAYLSLILGTVFTEELSLPWLNSAMLVRGIPSISAYSLISSVGSDWLRKLTVLSLSLASAATGEVQRGLTIFGVSMACIIFLVNLGSRAWYFLRWDPIRYNGPLASLVGFLGAMLCGLVAPYMGYTEVQRGGKAAMESIIKSAVLVAAVFVVSDYNEVQKFILVGSENCSQDGVNIVVGTWFTLTLVISLCFLSRVPRYQQWPDDDSEPLLVEEQASPVGFKVPNLPDFPVKPSLAKNGIPCCTVRLELLLGILVAFGIGGAIVYTAFTDWDDDWAERDLDIF